MKANLKAQLGQQLSLSPQLMQSIRLLQLSGLELEQEVTKALESNPLIEQEPPTEAKDEQNYSTLVGDRVSTVSEGAATPEVAPAAHERTLDVDVDDSFAASEAWERASSSSDDDDEDRNPYQRAAAPEQSLRGRIEGELFATLEGPPLAAAVLVMEHIDDNGYLSTSLAALSEQHGVPLPLLRKARLTIQELSPAGFAARNLRECLLAQMDDVKAGTPGKNLAEQLISDHLPAMAARDLEPLRAKLGASPERFAAAVALVRALNPRPGAEAASDDNRYIVPDVLVTGVNGAWKIELNPAALPRVRLNTLYEKALASASSAKGLKDKLNEARWLIRGLEMRHETLLRTSRVIFERQSSFLTSGEVAMRPLTLREVATAIAMHESTVSRVTTNKFAATPWGVFELKHFFSVSLAGGEAEASGVAVRAMIRQLVDTENPTKPLCDGAISALLGRKGVHVARRTVAKYREAMKIPPAPGRKRLPSPMRAIA